MPGPPCNNRTLMGPSPRRSTHTRYFPPRTGTRHAPPVLTSAADASGAAPACAIPSARPASPGTASPPASALPAKESSFGPSHFLLKRNVAASLPHQVPPGTRPRQAVASSRRTLQAGRLPHEPRNLNTGARAPPRRKPPSFRNRSVKVQAWWAVADDGPDRAPADTLAAGVP